MVSVPEALATILDHAHPLPAEEVHLTESAGRILAEDLVAPEDVPIFYRTSVDGYAVRSGDTSPVRTVLGEVTAGRLPSRPIDENESMRIMTGGAMPTGADAVVMVEEADESSDGTVRLLKLPRAGANVQVPGTDLEQGQPVLMRGVRLGGPEVGLLATVGRTRVPVFRRPRLAVLATGDEVVEPDQPPPPGSVRDSNRYALMAAIHDAGGEVVWHGHCADDEAALERQMLNALDQADVLLTSGGVSMGTRDLIKPILERIAKVHFGRVSFKPGKPLTFATLAEADNRFAFGLPGFPVSSLVTFEVFVRPFLLRLAGRAQFMRPRVDVALEHEITPDGARLEYQRATVRWQDGRFVGRNTGAQTSSRLASIHGANALLEIQPGSQTLPVGATVPALLLADL